MQPHRSCLDEGIGLVGDETRGRKIVGQDEGVVFPLIKLNVGTVHIAVVSLAGIEEVQILKGVESRVVGFARASSKIVDLSLVEF